ncbi:MAG: V-type ATP synthase subunit A [Oscillospiraceae bacterium]|nr:V-type ATP synthase subunit A [Candidatus Equicaccousia limihippi]
MANLIFGINGPVVTVKKAKDLFMQEMVLVGKEKLVGEVISVTSEDTLIQVYEETAGLTVGEEIISTGAPLCATLGPGIIGSIFDGIERPLKDMAQKDGAFISRGGDYNALNTDKEWQVEFVKNAGDMLFGGETFATVKETESIVCKIMLAPDMSGKIVEIAKDGLYRVTDTVCVIENQFGERKELTLQQKWPIRTPRPIKERLPLDLPLITGQRVIDTVLPIPKGGAAALPGGFGAGKTMTQHQIAKWCDADIIIYVGCGERGNEMTQVLDEFSSLIDPRTGKSLLSRTVLIANTSNMPVAAREASIYTGITLAEFYRDMGYDVAMMADSTSRWAEALREISGRLEEMPAEEGFPAYLPSRLAQFYERAGRVQTAEGNQGSVTVIGAVSPQGADFSEPVTQNTKRFTRAFWALDKALAYKRHYPAVNWMLSYSEYTADLYPYFKKKVADDFPELHRTVVSLLREENELMEIVKLIGSDVLPDDQKLIIDVAQVIRVGFLQQNARDPQDTYVTPKKQYLMLKVICHLYNEGKRVVAAARPESEFKATGIFDKVVRMKYDVPADRLDLFDGYIESITAAADGVLKD